MFLLPLLSGLLAVAGVVGIVTGLLLLADSKPRGSKTPKTLAWLQADLNQPHFIEKLVYRHHRKSGLALIAAAVVWLWLLSPLAAWRQFWALTWQYLKQLMNSDYLPVLAVAWLALTVLVIGVLLLVRPSLLRPLENWSNRWVTVFEKVNTVNAGIAKELGLRTLRTPRVTGVMLFFGGCACIWGALQLIRI